MSEVLAYQCPHCSKTVQIAGALTDKLVDCPECNRQFQAQAPVARPTSNAGIPTDTAEVVESESDAERTLRELHPVVFRNHLLLTMLCLLLGVGGIVLLVAGLVGSALLGLEGAPLLAVGAALLAAALIYVAYRLIQKMAVTLKITTDRTIVVRGIVAQSTNEVQHDDVRNIQCDRNVLERLLNYGDIALSSSGQDDMEIVVHDIPDPQGIIEIIRTHQ